MKQWHISIYFCQNMSWVVAFPDAYKLLRVLKKLERHINKCEEREVFQNNLCAL